MASQSDDTRIAWIDMAKALGIFLVFYGHILEVMYRYGGRPFLLPPLQFIYAYHMPLFFVLSGYLYRDKALTFGRFFRYLFLTRLVPFFFFNLLALGALLLQQAGRGGIDWQVVGRGCRALLWGTPSFNMLTWFLACLFTVELIHFGVGRRLTTQRRLLAGILCALMIGLPGARWAAQNLADTGNYFNIWYSQEALTAYAFYLMGIWTRQAVASWNAPGRRFKGDHVLFWLSLSLMFFVLTYLTVDRNQGPFVTDPGLVLMSISSHGSFVWFPITAVTGSLFLIFLSQLVPTIRTMHYFGQKTLILLGIGGLFFEFFNQPLVAISNAIFPPSPLGTTMQAILLTLLSLAICVPFIHTFETYLPQLVGKPSKAGPILPPLM
jgi:acyltransferase